MNSAFTLVEVVLAVMLGGTVAALAAAVAVQSMAARKVVLERLDERWPRIRAFRLFERDVESRIPELHETRGIAVNSAAAPAAAEGAGAAVVLVEFVALAEAGETGAVFRRRLPARIGYYVEDVGAGEAGRRLVRTVQDLTDPSSVVHRKVLIERLWEARVEFYRDGSWGTAVAAENAGPISGVRLICHWDRSGDLGDSVTVVWAGATESR